MDTHLLCSKRDRQIEYYTADKKYPIGIFAPDKIGRTCPQYPTNHIEYANHQNISCGKSTVYYARQGRAEDIGDHCLGNADNTNTGGDIEA